MPPARLRATNLSTLDSESLTVLTDTIIGPAAHHTRGRPGR